jgi:hypothetical protein
VAAWFDWYRTENGDRGSNLLDVYKCSRHFPTFTLKNNQDVWFIIRGLFIISVPGIVVFLPLGFFGSDCRFPSQPQANTWHGSAQRKARDKDPGNTVRIRSGTAKQMSRLIVFMVHKAASSGLYAVMARLAEQKSVPLYSANENTLPDIRENGASLTEHIAEREGIFGPIRRSLLIDGLYDSQMILHLRDPGDCLTSMYYSWAFSHTGIADAYREKVEADGY